MTTNANGMRMLIILPSRIMHFNTLFLPALSCYTFFIYPLWLELVNPPLSHLQFKLHFLLIQNRLYTVYVSSHSFIKVSFYSNSEHTTELLQKAMYQRRYNRLSHRCQRVFHPRTIRKSLLSFSHFQVRQRVSIRSGDCRVNIQFLWILARSTSRSMS